MKFWSICYTTAVFCFSSAVSADINAGNSGDYLEATGTAVAPMEKYKSRSQAKLMAKRGAKVDAQRNLSEAINGVKIVSGSVVKDMVLESDTIGTKMKGFLKGAFVVSDQVSEDADGYIAEVVLGVCLTRRLTECAGKPALSSIVAADVAKKEAETTQPLEPVAMAQSPAKEVAAPKQSAKEDTPVAAKGHFDMDDDGTPYTGLVVDARGLHAEKSMFARIYNEDGKLVYGASRVDDDVLGELGTVWYDDTLKGAIRIRAVGDNAIVINAKALAQGSRTDIVVSNEDANKIMSAVAKNDFMKNANVALVIN